MTTLIKNLEARIANCNAAIGSVYSTDDDNIEYRATLNKIKTCLDYVSKNNISTLDDAIARIKMAEFHESRDVILYTLERIRDAETVTT